jgi:hypothetical protein
MRGVGNIRLSGDPYRMDSDRSETGITSMTFAGDSTYRYNSLLGLPRSSSISEYRPPLNDGVKLIRPAMLRTLQQAHYSRLSF